MRKKNFTQIPNKLLNDGGLSLKAKGLFAYMQSKPKNWSFHLNGMQSQLKESRGTIIKIIDELIVKGYVKKIKSTKNGKQQINQYVLFDDTIKLTQNIRITKTESKNCTHSNTVPSNTSKSNTLYKKESFRKFKIRIIQTYKNQSFTTKGIGWLNTTPFIIDDIGFIFNTVSNQPLKTDEAFKVWRYLYKNYRNGEIFYEADKS